jgi:hypothetical protein
MNKDFFYFGILLLIMSFSSWYIILFNMDFIYALNDPVAIIVLYYNAPVAMLGGIAFLYGSFNQRDQSARARLGSDEGEEDE